LHKVGLWTLPPKNGKLVCPITGATIESMQPNKTYVVGGFHTLTLVAIGVLLAIIALRPLARPEVAAAQSDQFNVYIEPGTTMLRDPSGNKLLEGKVVIDLRNGNIWGFPTLSAQPYPVDATRTEPPVSSPMYLGKFDFSKMRSK